MPITIWDKEKAELNIRNAKVPILLELSTPSCVPCKIMLPILDELETEYHNRVIIAGIDITETKNDDLLAKLRAEVTAVPTFFVIINGKITDQLVGVQSADKLRNALDEALEK